MKHHLGRCYGKDSRVKAIRLNSIRSFTSEYQCPLMSSVDVTDIPGSSLSRKTQKVILHRSFYSIPSSTETFPALISSLLCPLNSPSHHLQVLTLDCQIISSFHEKIYDVCTKIHRLYTIHPTASVRRFIPGSFLNSKVCGYSNSLYKMTYYG